MRSLLGSDLRTWNRFWADFRQKRSEAAKDFHKTPNLAGRRGLCGFKITLNAQSGEEGQHHLRNQAGIHPGFLCRDIHGEKALQPRPALCHDRMRFVRKDGKLPHGVNGKASLLLLLVERSMFEKYLNVVPAQRFLSEKPPLLLALQIVTKTCDKQIFLVAKL